MRVATAFNFAVSLIRQTSTLQLPLFLHVMSSCSGKRTIASSPPLTSRARRALLGRALYSSSAKEINLLPDLDAAKVPIVRQWLHPLTQPPPTWCSEGEMRLFPFGFSDFSPNYLLEEGLLLPTVSLIPTDTYLLSVRNVCLFWMLRYRLDYS